MKRLRPVLSAWIFVLAGLGFESRALAQVRNPVVRGDFSGSIAWLLVGTGDSGEFDGDDWRNSFYGGLGAGWYWTDQLKTELDFGAGTENRGYSSRPITIQGQRAFAAVESTSQQRTLGVSQQYQFFRNAWFHPHVAVGANITWDRISEEFYPITIYQPSGPPRLVQPGRDEGPRTETTVSPFIATGFKAYMTRRSFFRTDLRFSFRGGVDDVLVRIGFGIDY